ncbi:MAG TPA: glycosyltransferase family 4 protein [Candidatus Thermoplasmatota archaeon]|nr:glycosyltransferase family 4 protein [Candidatus Thermoplasmatota archaeon]
MHIGYTVHRFWPSVGGTEMALRDLSQELRALGHEISVVTSDEPGRPPVEEVDGVRVRRFAMRRMGKFRFPPRDYAPFVLAGDWDVLHVKGQRVWSSDYLFRHVPKARQPRVFTAHGFHQYHMNSSNPVEWWYYRWHLPRMLRPFDKVIALTGNEVEELVRFGVDRGKIAILPDGVNLHEFKAPPERGFREKFGFAKPRLLVYAGGYYENKRVDFLVRAVSRMKGDAELAVIGRDPTGGKEQARCEALARELKAPVKFLGVIDRADVVKSFFEADLFLYGSRFEGYGIVLLEAMAAGTPFVSTPCGAAPDLAAKGAGVLASTPEEMAREADALLADEPRRRAMGDAGRRLAHAQTLAWAAKKHEALYQSLLRR